MRSFMKWTGPKNIERRLFGKVRFKISYKFSFLGYIMQAGAQQWGGTLQNILGTLLCPLLTVH